jgi:tagatose-1,6-bisphosphate aldolase non-catalytic subunit AgaZ/GatZ
MYILRNEGNAIIRLPEDNNEYTWLELMLGSGENRFVSRPFSDSPRIRMYW